MSRSILWSIARRRSSPTDASRFNVEQDFSFPWLFHRSFDAFYFMIRRNLDRRVREVSRERITRRHQFLKMNESLCMAGDGITRLKG
jgi:hypothetical protein